jgi:glycosyltransferase involved in cell wall biosynthesis
MTAATPDISKLKIAVGIASAGRPATLLENVAYIDSLKPRPDRIIVCVPNLDDAAGLSSHSGVELTVGPRGLTCQRNRIIQAASADMDVLIFLDDDFVPAPGFIPRMASVFAENADVVIATGDVLADGILGKGLTQSEAMHVIKTAGERDEQVSEIYNAYGCNMAVRLAPIVKNRLAFDEELPLYGWLEDVDFSRAIARYGRSVRISGACGVHLGVKSGRQPGKRLGYSQIANPVYLMRKGTISWTRALAQIGRNILANARGTLLNESVVDRRGRLNGNILALADVLVGRASPMRILELSQSSNREMSPPSIAAKRR